MAGRKIAWILGALLLAAMACLGGGGQSDSQATAEALALKVAQTATARAGESPDQGFDTAGNLATAEAQATQQALNAQATAEAIAALSAEQIEATRQAFAPILAELPKYGVDPEKGRPAWIHPPVTLDIDGYLQYDYANQFLGTVVTDFVMSADITWNTQFGTSGCGFALRNNGIQEAFDQYLLIATRGGSGRVQFAIMVEGEILNNKDFFAYGLDPNFDWRNDTTNRMTVVMRGPIVTLFTNDTQIAQFNVNDPPQRPFMPPAPTPPPDIETNPDAKEAYDAAKAEYDNIVGQINAQFRASEQAFREADVEFEKGFVVLVALSESGRTICQFDNAWLFLIEE